MKTIIEKNFLLLYYRLKSSISMEVDDLCSSGSYTYNNALACFMNKHFSFIPGQHPAGNLLSRKQIFPVARVDADEKRLE